MRDTRRDPRSGIRDPQLAIRDSGSLDSRIRGSAI